MSDELAPEKSPTNPESAPAVREVHAPLTSFVRGGTMTTAYENQLKQKRAEAEERRKQEDEKQAIARTDQNAHISTLAKLGGSRSHASIVLEIRNSDGHPEEFILCELTVDPMDPTGLILIVCCPKCAPRIGMDEANMTIRSKHRRFELDERRKGELWVNPRDRNEIAMLAGTIHLTEWVKCPVCSWTFRIDDSVVREKA